MTASLARVAVLAAVLALILGGCSGKRISDIDQPTASPASTGAPWAVPAGIAVAPGDRGKLEIDGLYPSIVPNDLRCCWIAPSATVKASEPAASTTMVLTVLVPEYPFFDDDKQGVRITLGGHTTGAPALAPGVHRIEVPVPAAARHAGVVTVGLQTDRSFVPAHENVNTDTRALGVILLGIAFK